LYNTLQTEKASFDTQLGLLVQEISARDKQVLDREETIESLKQEIANLNSQLDSANTKISSLKETITDLETKLHKIGQTEQTIFLNSQKNNRDYYSKEGLGFQNPCKFNKAYGKRPSLYSYEVQQIVDKYPEFGIKDLLVTNHAEHESERMKKHDGKFTTINFCYDYANSSWFSKSKQSYSKDYYMPFPPEEYSVTIEPKPYVPTLILEEKVTKLEEEVHKLQSENESLKTKISHFQHIKQETDLGGSESKSDTSSTKAFISVFDDSVSEPSISVSSTPNGDDYVEYDTEGESDFEGEFKKTDEDVFPVIGTDGYLKFKDKSQLTLDDEVQLFGVDKSALEAPLLTPTNESDPDETVTPSSFIPPIETVSIISTIRVKQSGKTSVIKSLDFDNSEFVVGESSSSLSDQVQDEKKESKSISKSKDIPVLNLKNSKLFKDKLVSSVDYNKKLPDHNEFVKLNKKFEQEKKDLLNQIKQLKADKARIKCDSIFWNRKCATLERNYDHLIERISIYETGHCYAGKNKKVIPAKIDESKFSEGVKSMLLYVHQRLKFQREKQLDSQTQKTSDSKINTIVSPVSESVQSGLVNDQWRKRRTRRLKSRKNRESSDKEKCRNVVSNVRKLNKTSFVFPKVVTDRVAPSTDVVNSGFNSIKSKSYSPKATISNKSTASSPRLIIANHLYLNRGPKLSWDPKSCAFVNTNLKGPIFKWVPKTN
jgi:prefoldin subunit 5